MDGHKKSKSVGKIIYKMIYNWVGKPITSINEVKNDTKMYHFSSGNDGMYGVPEDDIYVISAGRRSAFYAIKLKS